jgi:hypothetical protein
MSCIIKGAVFVLLILMMNKNDQYFLKKKKKKKKKKLWFLSRERKNFSPMLEEKGIPSPPPPLSVSFYAFCFMLSFLLVFSLLERTLISLGLALDQPGPLNINSCILPSHLASSPSWIVPSVPPPEGFMELSRSTI